MVQHPKPLTNTCYRLQPAKYRKMKRKNQQQQQHQNTRQKETNNLRRTAAAAAATAARTVKICNEMRTGCARVQRTTIQNIIYTPKYTKLCTVINMYRIYSLCYWRANEFQATGTGCCLRCNSHINWIDSKMRCERCGVEQRRRVEQPAICAGNKIGRMFLSMCGSPAHTHRARRTGFPFFFRTHLYASESRWNIYYILKSYVLSERECASIRSTSRLNYKRALVRARTHH